MTTFGWVALGSWVACWVLVIRPGIRFFNDDMPVDGWAGLTFNIGCALFFTGIVAPGIAVCWIFNATIAKRFDAKHVAAMIEGTPKGERLEAQVRELESENARLDALLEREVGVR